MEGEVKGKTFKMKGHTLPGINQRIDANATNVAEQGLAGSSAFQTNGVAGTFPGGAGNIATATQRINPPPVAGGAVTNPSIGGGVGGSVIQSKPSAAKIFGAEGKRKPNPDIY